MSGAIDNAASNGRPGPPLWLLLELTYRCPLHCVYCSNPTEFARTGPELGTDDWLRVLREARALGAVQLGLSGGEPLVRDDLEPIVAEAHGNARTPAHREPHRVAHWRRERALLMSTHPPALQPRRQPGRPRS